MAPRQAKPNTPKVGRQPSRPKDQEKRPQGIKKERPQISSHKSARQKEIRLRQERTISKDRNTEPKHPLPSPTSITVGDEFPRVEDQKRKRSPYPAPGEPLRKRRRTSLADAAVKDTYDQEVTSGINNNKTNLIDYWREKRRWPEEY